MREKIVYLSGAMLGCTDEECRDWREYTKQHLRCATRDPMVRDYRGREMEGMIDMVENDKADIDASDVVLVNFVKPSVGTSMEVLYAWERSKKVILIAPQSTVISPWLVYHSHHVFPTVEDAVAHINRMSFEGITEGNQQCQA
ncbi:MAG: nucleoside 2-deoxyribosyltransferase [Acidobacteria bacterium]|nr:nucleoside 2-deoxyribosyltransferase [Acidobacteriota bacterium]